MGLVELSLIKIIKSRYQLGRSRSLSSILKSVPLLKIMVPGKGLMTNVLKFNMGIKSQGFKVTEFDININFTILEIGFKKSVMYCKKENSSEGRKSGPPIQVFGSLPSPSTTTTHEPYVILIFVEGVDYRNTIKCMDI